MNAINYQCIPVDEIEINPYELAMRLHTEKGFESENITQCLEVLKSVVNCKFSSTRVPVKICGDIIDCGFGEFKSSTLVKNLKDSREVFIFAVTLGMGVDRLLSRLSALSAAEYFITDALASALAEAAMNEAERRVKGDVLCRPRFSPGFGDLKIEMQPQIIEFLNANKLLGITVNRSYLMSPMKSVTAFMGIL